MRAITGPHGLFTLPLAAAVAPERGRWHILMVGTGGGAIKHVIGGKVDQGHTGLLAGFREVRCTIAIDGKGSRWFSFRLIDCSVGGSVDNNMWTDIFECLP